MRIDFPGMSPYMDDAVRAARVLNSKLGQAAERGLTSPSPAPRQQAIPIPLTQGMPDMNGALVSHELERSRHFVGIKTSLRAEGHSGSGQAIAGFLRQP